MDSSNLQAFNERLNQWIAQQGFWFQLRYSMSAGGGFSTVVYHALRIAFRLLLVALLVAGGFFWFLNKRVETPKFKAWMTQTLARELGAKELRINRYSRTQGQLDIGRLACLGGDEAFFTKLEAKNVRCRMGLLDGFVGEWNAGPLAAGEFNIDVKAGADDAEKAQWASEAFFRRYPNFHFPSVESGNTTVRWGYSARTFGSIENSRMTSQRSDDGWRLQFREGYFSQNWLHRLKIVELTAVCDPSGLRIEKGVLRSEEGNKEGLVTLDGVTISGGELPMVTGSVRLEHVPLETVLPKRLHGLLEGTISGNFKLRGSTNTGDGIGFDGQVVLEGDDAIVLRDRLYLLRALQVVDGGVNGFRKVVFREGSFSMRTGGDRLELEKVELKAGEAMALIGALRVRLPTQAEIDAALARTPDADLASLFSKEGVAGADEEEFTLKKAAEAGDRTKTAETRDHDWAKEFEFLDEQRARQEQRAQIERKSLRYEGRFQITLPSSAFVRAPELRAAYPPDATTNRITLNVPIQGNIDEITLQQAQELYDRGRRAE